MKIRMPKMPKMPRIKTVKFQQPYIRGTKLVVPKKPRAF
jgi:hypothetical protein